MKKAETVGVFVCVEWDEGDYMLRALATIKTLLESAITLNNRSMRVAAI